MKLNFSLFNSTIKYIGKLISYLFGGYFLYVLWMFFLVPGFGVPVINFWLAVGLVMFIDYFVKELEFMTVTAEGDLSFDQKFDLVVVCFKLVGVLVINSILFTYVAGFVASLAFGAFPTLGGIRLF